jgi:phage-related minor tail protein
MIQLLLISFMSILLLLLYILPEHFDNINDNCNNLKLSNEDWQNRIKSQIQQTNTAIEEKLKVQAELEKSNKTCDLKIKSLQNDYQERHDKIRKEMVTLEQLYKEQVTIFNNKLNKYLDSMNDTIKTTNEGNQSLQRVGELSKIVS